MAITSVAFVVIITRHVPWVNSLCFTEAIYHVVKMYEANEAPPSAAFSSVTVGACVKPL